MKKIMTLAATVLFAVNVQAGSVIVHPSNSATIDSATIKRLFLGKVKSFPGGAAAVPVTLAEGSSGAETFNQTLLNKSSSQLKSYWAKLIFTGRAKPLKTAGDDAEMINLVSGNPDMIGFVEGDASGDVKVVASF